MSWSPGQPLPYDGWYNGHIGLMIANGTFEDFRPKLAERVKYGLMKAEILAEADKEWAKIPLAEKESRRALVVEESTPKPVELITNKGKVIAYKAKPSDNNNAALDTKQKGKERVPRPSKKLPKGALTHENSPLKPSPSK